jgi:hypothetical protein
MGAEWVRDVAVAFAAGSVPAFFGYLTSTRRSKALANGVASRTTREEFQALNEAQRHVINDLRSQVTNLQVQLDMERQEKRDRDAKLNDCMERVDEESRARQGLQWIVDQIRRGRDPGPLNEERKRDR